MTAIERIGKIVEADGFSPTLAAVEGRDPGLSPLLVPFRPDELGRELALFIEVMPGGAEGEVTLINFSVIYPLEILDTDRMAELVRVLFLLNRFLPIGSHGFCEQTPAVYFAYGLAVGDAEAVDPSVVTECVGMIGYFTRHHGRYIERVLAGEVTCDDLLAELEMTGETLPPLFARVLADSPDAQPL